jgi:hypothetical protein
MEFEIWLDIGNNESESIGYVDSVDQAIYMVNHLNLNLNQVMIDDTPYYDIVVG